MKATPPFFSVVTPSFQQGKFLEGCIQSVLDQNDPDFEHWIFDNCSSDETSSVAARFSHVRFLSESDRGQAHAVNKGFQAASGEILCWLNADDRLAPETFRTLRRTFDDPTIAVVYGDAIQITYDGRGEILAPARFDSRLDLLKWWSPLVKLHQPSVFFRRSLVDTVGELREDLHYALDYEFWWRLSEHHTFHYLPQPLAIQHRQPESKTILDWEKVLAERERIFAPLDFLLNEPGSTLTRERKNGLAELFWKCAFATLSDSPSASLSFAWKALRQRPEQIFRLAGLLRRMAVPGSN